MNTTSSKFLNFAEKYYGTCISLDSNTFSVIRRMNKEYVTLKTEASLLQVEANGTGLIFALQS